MKENTPTSMKSVRPPKPRFKVGDLVQYEFFSGTIVARIVEDRRPIGYKGRRLYRIVGKDGELTRKLEMPEEELIPFVRDVLAENGE